MSKRTKREASEYITKEHGSEPNDRAPDPKKMATAAQLARRKLATPRSRLNPSSRSQTPTNTSNVFGSTLQPQTQSQQQPGSMSVNGFTFGGNNSFPPGTQAPGSSFTFESQNAGSNNPFLSQPNWGAESKENHNGAWASGGGSHEQEMTTDSPEKKKTQSFTFGQTPPSQPQFTFGMTGNNSGQQNGNIFGSSQPAAKINQPAGGLFGAVASTTPPSTNDVFAPGLNRTTGVFNSNQSSRQSSQEPPQNNPFGPVQPQQSGALFGFKPQESQPSNVFGQTQSAPPSFAHDQSTPQFSFGQSTTTDSQQKPQSQSFGLFGQSTPGQSSQTPVFGGFGQNNTQEERPTSPFKFGQPAPQQDQAQLQSGGLFGSTSQTRQSQQQDAPAQQEPPKAPVFSFGQTSGNAQSSGGFNFASSKAASQPAGTPFSFSGFGAQKSEEPKQNGPVFGQAPAEPSSAETQKPMNPFNFGQAPVAEPPQANETQQTAEAPKQPFAGLFTQQTQSQAQTTTAETQATNTPSFNFPAAPTPTAMTTGGLTTSSTSTSNLFGAPKPAGSNLNLSNPFGAVPNRTEEPSNDPGHVARTNEKAPKPAFSFGSSQLPSSGGLFSPTKSTVTEEPRNPVTPAAQRTSTPTAQTEPSKPPVFAATPASESSQQTPATEKPKKRLFGQTLDRTPANPESTANASSANFGPRNSETGKVTGESPSDNSSLIGRQVRETAATPVPATSVAAPIMAGQSAAVSAKAAVAEKSIHTVSSSRIPGYINAEGYKEFDNNARLRSLNREFKDVINALDPNTNDFDNIVRYYIAARTSIGSDIGLYQSALAGTKRKNGFDEEELDVPPQYKKNRADESGRARSVPIEPPTASATQAPAPASKATSIFNNMIPKSPQKTPVQQSQNSSEGPPSVFASVPAAPTSSSNLFGSAFKPTQPLTPQPNSQSTSQSSNVFGQVPATAPAKATNMFAQPAASTTPVKSPSKKPAFAFKASEAGSGNAFAAFAKAADAGKKKRTAEQMLEYDSDEESQAEGRKELEENERAKKAKYDSIAKVGFTPAASSSSGSQKPAFSFSKTPSASNSPGPKTQIGAPFESTSSSSSEEEDDQNVEGEDVKDGEYQPSEEEEDNEGSDDEVEGDDDHGGSSRASANGETTNDEDDDHTEEIANNPNAGKSLFDRITPNAILTPTENEVNGSLPASTIGSGNKQDDTIRNSSSRNPAFKPAVWGSEIGQGTPEAPGFSPVTPFGGVKSPYKPATTFNFTPTPPTTTPTPSLTGSVLLGAPTGAGASKFEGMFGSRPSTPDPGSQEASAPTSAPADQTWKVGTPIKFGSSSRSLDAPAINVTDASPSREGETPKPFGGLFGTPATSTKDSSSDVGFVFGSKPAPGFLGASSHLQAGSGLSSALSSRATSPGLTDNESLATTDNEDEAQQDEQASLMASRTGEEDEDCLLEMKSKALKFINSQEAEGTKFKPNEWNSVGTGMLRVLKNKDTGKTRILFRVEPSANILINQNLLKDFKWESIDQGKNGAVKGAFVTDVGKGSKLQRWVFKVKTVEKADELKNVLETQRVSN